MVLEVNVTKQLDRFTSAFLCFNWLAAVRGIGLEQCCTVDFKTGAVTCLRMMALPSTSDNYSAFVSNAQLILNLLL